MSRLSAPELADRSGVTADRVSALVDAGVLIPADDGTFEASDVQRVRLVDALEDSGIALRDLAGAVADGHLTFAFVGAIWPEPVGLVPGLTLAGLAERFGLPFEFIRRARQGLGLPTANPDDPVREDDVELFPSASAAMSAGFDEAALARHSRLLGDGLRRIADSQVALFHRHVEEPMLGSATPRQIMELASQLGGALRPATEDLLLVLYRRHLERAIVEDIVEHVEDALQRSGIPRRTQERPPAIAFLDVTGYTRLTEEHGDAAAAELAEALEELVHDVTRDHGGRPVKFLGDGVMLHFASAEAAVVGALDAVEAAPAAGLPACHVGIHCGPVIHRDGDYFGRTVNLAARISGRAGPSEVLVTDAVVEAAPNAARYGPVGAAELKGVREPVALHRARRVA